MLKENKRTFHCLWISKKKLKFLLTLTLIPFFVLFAELNFMNTSIAFLNSNFWGLRKNVFIGLKRKVLILSIEMYRNQWEMNDLLKKNGTIWIVKWIWNLGRMEPNVCYHFWVKMERFFMWNLFPKKKQMCHAIVKYHQI